MAIKAYRMTLTALGPVFVGNGKEYVKKEYLMLSRDSVGIADMNKIYALAYRKKIARQFEDFMLGRTVDAWGREFDLGRWLESVKLKEEAVKTCLSYVLDMGDTPLARGQRTQIMACMKNAYGIPYVPGSSIKGALRTILATAKMMSDTGAREAIGRDLKKNLPLGKKRNYYLASTAKLAEDMLFRTLDRKDRKDTKPGDAVNDTMQGLILGDSEPIADPKALVLAQKIDRNKDGNINPINLLREALRPGTRIVFPLTIDESICPMTADDIVEAIYTFDEAYNRNFLTKFSGMDPLRPDRPQMFLGGGAGFVSKTLVYPVLGQKEGVEATAEIFRQTRVPEKHRHYRDIGLGVSPHIVKCTRYKGKILQMGLCEAAIETL